ncbi:MAG: hypothetical protein ACYTKD_14760, partial [Planctomycetota bacterium]
MGAPGGAVYLGHVFGWIANDLRSIIERMGHVPVRGPDAVLGDVPLLIKALELHEDEVRADARRALARIAREDLGDRPEPWREWWDVGYSLYSSSPYPLWVRFLPPLAPLVSVSNGAGSIATA